MKIIRLLLDRGADIEAKDNGGKTALINAALCGMTKAVEVLLGMEADVRAKDAKGRTALCYAAMSGKAKIAELIASKSAGPDARDAEGRTALMHAAMAADDGGAKAVKVLLGMGADTQATDAAGKTAMGLAVEALLADKLKEANVKNLLKAGLPATAADAEALIAGLEAKDPKAAAKQRKGRSSLYNLMLAQA